MLSLRTRIAVRRLEASPFGLFSRAEALAAGLSADDVKRLVRGDAWVAIRTGWYVEQSHWQALDDRTGRPTLVVRAAHRSLRNEHVVSHTSAALVCGIPFLRPRRDLVHVTKFWTPRARVRSGIKHHQARYRRQDVRVVEGIPVLSEARTALDIARELGFATGVAALDAVLQRGATRADLERELSPMRHWPGLVQTKEALQFSDPGAESVGESLLRILLAELDLGPIQTQFELRDSTGRARCDLRIGRHVFEFEGLIKLLARDQGGVADRPAVEVLAARQARHDWVCGFQLGMSHVTWDELWGSRRERTSQRLRREYRATVARFGTTIDDLAPYVVRRAQ